MGIDCYDLSAVSPTLFADYRSISQLAYMSFGTLC
jgi:hypothetical protein